MGSTTLKYGEVILVTRTSPWWMRPKSSDVSTSRAGPSYTPVLTARPVSTVSEFGVSGTPKRADRKVFIAAAVRRAGLGNHSGGGGGAGMARRNGGASDVVIVVRH